MSSAMKNTVHYDFYARGQTYSSPFPKLVFCLLRALDPFLQYQILANGLGSSLLRKVGFEIILDGPAIQTGIALIDGLGLSPFRLLLLAMATGGALKQIFWATYLCREPLWISSAISGGIYNTVCNTTNDLFATTAFFSSGVAGRFPAVVVGTAFYLSGLITETVAEYQRKVFKDDPTNNGKVFSKGLWSLARHINYTGYTAYRAGYSLTAGSWYWGAFAAVYLVNDFGNRAIPSIDGYCSKRYGAQWEEFKRKNPSRLIPGIW